MADEIQESVMADGLEEKALMIGMRQVLERWPICHPDGCQKNQRERKPPRTPRRRVLFGQTRVGQGTRIGHRHPTSTRLPACVRLFEVWFRGGGMVAR